MSIQEKTIWVSMVGTLLSYGLFYYFALAWYQEGMDFFDEMKYWAKGLLILIPIQIGFKVVPMIIFHIIHYIITKEEVEHYNDEFNRLIEAKGNRNFYYVFQAGFYFAMISLLFDMGLFFMFNTIIVFMLLGTLFMDASQIYFYRKGLM